LKSWMSTFRPAPGGLGKTRQARPSPLATSCSPQLASANRLRLERLVDPVRGSKTAHGAPRFTVAHRNPHRPPCDCRLRHALSRSNTIWIRSRCAAGSFPPQGRFSVPLDLPLGAIDHPFTRYQMVKANHHITQAQCLAPGYRKSSIQSAMERYTPHINGAPKSTSRARELEPWPSTSQEKKEWMQRLHAALPCAGNASGAHVQAHFVQAGNV